MPDPVATALSGLVASTVRVSQAARNIANAESRAPGPDAEAAGAAGGFVPRDTVQSAVAAGGVAAATVPRTPPSLLAFRPEAPNAAADGSVAVPNVDFTREFAEILSARAAFKANAAVLETAAEVTDRALDIRA